MLSAKTVKREKWALWDLNPRHSDVPERLRDLESDILAELDQAPVSGKRESNLKSESIVLNFAFEGKKGKEA